MIARLPARYGAHTSLPSTVQDSVSDRSQLPLFSNWSLLPLRSWRAPAAPYLETSVLPSSMTSGGLAPAKAASSLVVTLLHCWSWTLTVSLGWAALKSALTASMTCGGALPSISQMVSVRGPAWACWPEPDGSSPPHAASSRDMANARMAVMRSRRDMGPSLLLLGWVAASRVVADLVGAVGQAGGAHGVGDQHHTVGALGLQQQAHGGRVDVDVVGDQLAG